jgi:hypothetical protein
MFLILQRFIEIINDLEFLYSPIASKRFSIPDEIVTPHGTTSGFQLHR